MHYYGLYNFYRKESCTTCSEGRAKTMAQRTPKIVNSTLSINEGQDAREIHLNSPEWFAWLQTASAFSYQQYGVSFTAQRRERKGHWYWYAYAKRDGRVHSIYMGRAESLSAERLRIVAMKLNARIGEADNLDISQSYSRKRANERNIQQKIKQLALRHDQENIRDIAPEQVSNLITTLRKQLYSNHRMSYEEALQTLCLAELLLDACTRKSSFESISRSFNQSRSEVDWQAERKRSGGEIF